MIGFLTDENISPKTISFLRSYGLDIKDIKEERLSGNVYLPLGKQKQGGTPPC
ncbi:MAG: hypothetical protein HPY70_11695 [Firmicutes bacterium]|nr:hypothetical protein [Bacillota bacterium]